MTRAGEGITVRQLNLYVKSLIEGDPRLSCVSVTGEISNFKNHYASGHWYFTLKDADAAVRCVMFRTAASRVRFAVSDGMTVTVRGRVSLYERDGQYQLYAEELSEGGEGELARLFEQTRQKLLEEGLFAPEHKRPLPPFPKRIAVLTSATGAAVQDILNITARRYPLCEIVLCPVAVQGEAAVGEMLEALERVYRLADIDLIIVGRGGGSAEELSAYNDERLARKLYESPVPVISAVGHETDFTICDFVADLRAPTPSAAAELAVPDAAELKARVSRLRTAARQALENRYRQDEARFRAVSASPLLRRPLELIETRALRLDRLSERLRTLTERSLETKNAAFSNAAARLDALSPLKVMARGFAAVRRGAEPVRSAAQLSAGDRIFLKLADGSAGCLVEETDYEN